MLSHFQIGDVAFIDFPATADPSLITTSQKPEDVVLLAVGLYEIVGHFGSITLIRSAMLRYLVMSASSKKLRC